MNLLAALAALSATARMLATLLTRWLEEKRQERLANLVAKGIAHDKLAQAVSARNRASGDVPGAASLPGGAPADPYRRD
jgi:hypothetical protein